MQMRKEKGEKIAFWNFRFQLALFIMNDNALILILNNKPK